MSRGHHPRPPRGAEARADRPVPGGARGDASWPSSTSTSCSGRAASTSRAATRVRMAERLAARGRPRDTLVRARGGRRLRRAATSTSPPSCTRRREKGEPGRRSILPEAGRHRLPHGRPRAGARPARALLRPARRGVMRASAPARRALLRAPLAQRPGCGRRRLSRGHHAPAGNAVPLRAHGASRAHFPGIPEGDRAYINRTYSRILRATQTKLVAAQGARGGTRRLRCRSPGTWRRRRRSSSACGAEPAPAGLGPFQEDVPPRSSSSRASSARACGAREGRDHGRRLPDSRRAPGVRPARSRPGAGCPPAIPPGPRRRGTASTTTSARWTSSSPGFDE